ncbi:MAG: hypothetical protein ABIC04_03645 [Nanoarchaeota archaeon]
MIGKPEWFERRKYGGWGFHPKTRQGWIYIALIITPFAIFQALPYWNTQLRTYITVGWVSFLLLDAAHIMIGLKRDEREFKIEAISERNAAWFMVLCLAVGILYQVITSALQQKIAVDPFLVAALFGGMIAKTISNLVLEKRAL